MAKRALFSLLVFAWGAALAPAQNPAPVLPAGATLQCRLDGNLSTRASRQGDSFTATVSQPVILNGRTMIPAGVTLKGYIAYLAQPGRIHGVGEMRLAPEKLTWPAGRTQPLNAVLYSVVGVAHTRVAGGEGTVKGPSSWKRTTLEVGGLAAGGGLIGGVAFAHPVLGLVTGGTGGFLDHVRRRGTDLSLPQGTQLNYQLTRDMPLPALTGP
ncbi:MAG TPA: hypothetical protein VKM93_01005 [Terriglobia bacterium]|nr:hypothetical protein [Terriglobia bacterium]